MGNGHFTSSPNSAACWIRRITGAFFAATLAAFPVSAAAEQAAPLPPEVRTYFDSARQECVQAGDRLHVSSEGFTETADFNGDSRTDYIVQLAALHCPPLGYSQYCGSAGCQISILVSDGDRLREVYSDNLQAFVVTQPVGGKQNIAFGAHGTYCGHQTGADTCFGTMSWTPKGFKTTYSAKAPAALQAELARANAEAGDDRPDKNPKYDWKLIAGKGPSIAMSDGSPDRMKTVVACAEKIPVIVASFPAGSNAPPPGAPVMIELGDGASDHADLVLQPVEDKTAYIGQLSRAALSLLQSAGAQDYAVIPESWTTQDRDYWTDTPGLPLTNFNQTSKAVLASCAGNLR